MGKVSRDKLLCKDFGGCHLIVTHQFRGIRIHAGIVLVIPRLGPRDALKHSTRRLGNWRGAALPANS